jgi:hypothetical protein
MRRSRKAAEDLMAAGSLFAQSVGIWALGRRIVKTVDGHIGLGLSSAEVDDEIWILPRSQVPFILRKATGSTSGSKYRLIGECYVHGLMHGEYFAYNMPEWVPMEII